MPFRGMLTIAPLAALSACAMADAPSPDTPVPAERETITYSTQPCFGFCPVYSVTVSPNGEGTFEGTRHVDAVGTHVFRVDVATYRRFAGLLAEVRPESGDRNISHGTPDCGNAPTDQPSINVRWSSDTGAADRTLRLYLGCNSAEAKRVAGVLKAAPEILPIAGFIGDR